MVFPEILIGDRILAVARPEAVNVVTAAAHHRVGASSAMQRIRTGIFVYVLAPDTAAAVQTIVARAALKRVGAIAAVQGVVAVAAGQCVVAALSVDAVISGLPVETVVAVTGPNAVVPGPARNRVVSGAGRHGIVSGTRIVANRTLSVIQTIRGCGTAHRAEDIGGGHGLAVRKRKILNRTVHVGPIDHSDQVRQVQKIAISVADADNQIVVDQRYPDIVGVDPVAELQGVVAPEPFLRRADLSERMLVLKGISILDPVGAIARIEDIDIVAAAAVQRIATDPANQGIVALDFVTATQDTAAPEKNIIARTAEDQIIPGVAINRVVTGTAGQRVTSASRGDDILPVAAIRDIVPVSGNDAVVT